MALQLGALRDALLGAGASAEKAERAAEELAGYENCFAGTENRLAGLESRLAAFEERVNGRFNRQDWMIGFNLALTLAILWPVFGH